MKRRKAKFQSHAYIDLTFEKMNEKTHDKNQVAESIRHRRAH